MCVLVCVRERGKEGGRVCVCACVCEEGGGREGGEGVDPS